MSNAVPLNFSTYNEIAKIFYVYLEYNCTWGSLHIVLDDNNIDRGSIEFCLNYALESADYLGAYLASFLLTFSDAELEYMKNNPNDPLDYTFLEIILRRGNAS